MNSDKSLGKAAMDKMDGFGGIIGYQYTSNGQTNIPYVQLQKAWKLLDTASCQDLTDEQVQAYKPTNWDEAKLGTWSGSAAWTARTMSPVHMSLSLPALSGRATKRARASGLGC